jgi:hypothetical protein
MSAPIPGQYRRGFLSSQIRHFMFREARLPLSYHWVMRRTDVFLKIELEHAEDDPPQRIAAEICRRIEKLYGVRSVEVSNLVTHAEQ